MSRLAFFGVGRRVEDQLLDTLPGQGPQRTVDQRFQFTSDLGVRLHVTEGNQAARRLYTAHGFKSTGVWEPLREGSALQVEELQLVE